MKPPYEITSKILKLTSSVSEKIGEIKSAKLIKPPTELRNAIELYFKLDEFDAFDIDSKCRKINHGGTKSTEFFYI